MNSLLYNIASITLLVRGESICNFDQYLSAYRNFIINDDKKNNVDIEFNVGCSIDKNDFKSVFVEQVENIVFEQYINTKDNTMMVRALFDGKEHYLVALGDFSKAYTDANLDNTVSAYILDRFILITFLCRAIDFDIIKIHASSISKDGRSIAFVGVSGTGKSTHSRLWIENVDGAELLNDDEPFVRILKSGEILLYGAPWSGSAKCFKNKSYPLKAIVHLFQAKENKLERLSPLYALETLLSSINSLPMYRGMRKKQIEIIYKIIEKIPVYKFECLPNADAVTHTRKVLEDE